MARPNEDRRPAINDWLTSRKLLGVLVGPDALRQELGTFDPSCPVKLLIPKSKVSEFKSDGVREGIEIVSVYRSTTLSRGGRVTIPDPRSTSDQPRYLGDSPLGVSIETDGAVRLLKLSSATRLLVEANRGAGRRFNNSSFKQTLSGAAFPQKNYPLGAAVDLAAQSLQDANGFVTAAGGRDVSARRSLSLVDLRAAGAEAGNLTAGTNVPPLEL